MLLLVFVSVSPITGLTVTPVKSAAAPNTVAYFNVNVTTGSNMTISMIDVTSDNVLETQWAPEPENITQMSHVFTEVKRYTLIFNVSNDVSQDNITLTFDVDIPITGVSATITATRPNEECVLNITMVTGSRSQFYVTWDMEFSAALISDSFFVARHNHTEIGIFNVSISVQNSVSMSNVTVIAYVSYDITGLTLSQVDYSDTPAFRNATFLSTINNGSHMTFVTNYGDDFFTVDYFDDPPLTNQFPHEYASIGNYTMTVDAFNHVSSASTNITFEVNVAIVNFQVTAPATAIINTEFPISLSVSRGNPVYYRVTAASNGMLDTLVETELKGEGDEITVQNTTKQCKLSELADTTLRAVVSNTVNGQLVEETKLLHVNVYELVDNVSAVTDKGFHVKTGEQITFSVSAAKGSLVVVVADFGDGTTNVARHHPRREANDAPVEFDHEYQTAGNYTVTFNSSNIFSSSVFTLSELIIQNPVPAIRLHVSPSPVAMALSQVTYTVELTDTSTLPSEPFCSWTFPDNTVRTVYATALAEGKNYTETFGYGVINGELMIGEQNVNVSCSNLVSSEQASETVVVQSKVENGALDITHHGIAVSKPALFGARAFNGSHVKFTVDFGDGSSPSVQDHPDQLHPTEAVTFEHTYTTVGNYTINVTLSNDVSSTWFINSEPIVVQAELEGLILESNSPVIYHEDIIYTIKTQQVGVTENMFMAWVFGDGRIQNAFVESLTVDKAFTLAHRLAGSSPRPLVTNVTCSNMVSSLKLTTYVVIQAPISDVSLSANTTHIAASSAARFTASANTGSDITYNIDYGDDDTEAVTDCNAGATVSFEHHYASTGNYTVQLTALNNVSTAGATLASPVIVQHPVKLDDIHLTLDNPTLSTNEPRAVFIIDVAAGHAKPTDVHIKATFPGRVVDTFIGSIWPFDFIHLFSGIPAGNVTGSFVLSNLVSSCIFNKSIQLQKPISGLTVTVPEVAKKGDIVTIVVEMAGSHVIGQVDFGDNIEESIPRDSITNKFNLMHAYATADTFVVTVTLTNAFNTKTEHSETLKVETLVDGLTLVGSKFVKIPDGKLQLSIMKGDELVSTPLMIDTTYAPGVSMITNSPVNTNIKLTHSYGQPGSYTVRVNVSNNVDCQILTKDIEVIEAITRTGVVSKPD